PIHERVVRAFSNSDIELPPRKITVNLSPAGLRKQGSGFDLPIAVAILTAMGVINADKAEGRLFVGELSLDGRINRVRGILPIAIMGREQGIKSVVVPKENAYEGAVIEDVTISGVSTLRELIECLNEDRLPETPHVSLNEELEKAYTSDLIDFADINGQEKARRATEVAVAGFHNLLYIGPPGSGKSMMARRIPTILSRLTRDECLEISKIYSVTGMLPENSLMLNRPFRDPHHSITGPALIGGQGNPKPGEITLAHKGVLFLDEAAEFRKDVIEMLRQPIEDKKVVISRMRGNVVFPSDFMLVMAMNPCRCGYYPDRQHCRCSLTDVDRYFGRIRGPVLDRVDICVGTSKLQINELNSDPDSNMSSSAMRERITAAQNIQRERFRNDNILFNSQMGGKETEKYCIMAPDVRNILDTAYRKYNMSARGYYRILKVARTIADLEECRNIEKRHVMEAVGYRITYGE
ncbi:MAG: YifB family Mg chelatase-like AAA ATPase, partial [Parasporobacterium sp.]|nr:YifB family Mg chelatase-like AAA ATPase [Parasporobacterium sp.]